MMRSGPTLAARRDLGTDPGGECGHTAAPVAPPAAFSRPRAVDDSDTGMSRPAFPSPNGGMLP
jgi:hypothetical protein